jgi:hypothetical protein
MADGVDVSVKLFETPLRQAPLDPANFEPELEQLPM